MEHRVEMLSDGTKKFFITENGKERVVSEEDYHEFNKTDKERENDYLREQLQKLKEELQDDLRKFMSDVNRIGVSMRDIPKTTTSLIDSNSLTNFLLWKMLKGKI